MFQLRKNGHGAVIVTRRSVSLMKKRRHANTLAKKSYSVVMSVLGRAVSVDGADFTFLAKQNVAVYCSAITNATSHVPAVVLHVLTNVKTVVFIARVREDVERLVRPVLSLAHGTART